ncbi:MAG TPA: trypsin-like peptidase domain-containing protein [Aggregatilineaceae bacterium]|nr:trypsin-like peptidase domain-containing protein [Aggregatilineaceae bacterium]
MKQSIRILLVTALMVAVVVVLSTHLFPSNEPSVKVMAAQTSPVLSTHEMASDNTFTQVYDEVSPSVVAISASAVSHNRVVSAATGSGFVVDDAGYIVTNNHVIEGANQIEIDFYDGTLTWAEVVGVDPDSDLAVLKVDVPADTLQPVTFGDSDTLQIGETVLAIGSPFGQDWTLTSGIISGLDRTIQGLTQFSIGGVIQTDAAINPGNSGGPLLNLDGDVIGVNSQIATTSNSNSGVGFAIPGNLAQRVVQDLITNGKTEYSYIGIAGTDITMSVIEALGIPNNTRGIAVTDVVSDSPAARAGMQGLSTTMQVNGGTNLSSMDVITAIDGYALKGMDDLISYLARETVPGQTVRLTVLRDGKDWTELDVVLDERP